MTKIEKRKKYINFFLLFILSRHINTDFYIVNILLINILV